MTCATNNHNTHLWLSLNDFLAVFVPGLRSLEVKNRPADPRQASRLCATYLTRRVKPSVRPSQKTLPARRENSFQVFVVPSQYALQHVKLMDRFAEDVPFTRIKHKLGLNSKHFQTAIKLLALAHRNYIIR